MIEELNIESLRIELNMNRRKTEVTMNGQVQAEEIKIQDKLLEVVYSYRYLGKIIEADTLFGA